MSGETAAVVRGPVHGTVQLRHTERGTPAARFTVMQVPREYDRARGQWHDGEPIPVICTVTGPLARHVAECLTDAVHVIATGNVALRDNVLYLDSAQVGVDLAHHVAYVDDTLPAVLAGRARAPARSPRRTGPSRPGSPPGPGPGCRAGDRLVAVRAAPLLGRRHRAQPHQALTAPSIQHTVHRGTGMPAGRRPVPKVRHAQPRPARARRPLHPRPARRRTRPVLCPGGLGAARPPRQQRTPGPVQADRGTRQRTAVLPVRHPVGRGLARGPGRPRSRLPVGLWARGGDQLPQLTASAVAVTGNRNATEQAITRARAFATAVAEAGHTVTATLAYGVDSAAHRASALAGRATLAVLPRGLDRAHPHDHAQLLSTVPATGGAVVSLYRPGTEASGATLGASATLLAALVRTVVLIEALDHAEAAMHTAEVAADLNRPLLAPPATEDIRAEGSTRPRRAARRPGPGPRANARPALTSPTAPVPRRDHRPGAMAVGGRRHRRPRSQRVLVCRTGQAACGAWLRRAPQAFRRRQVGGRCCVRRSVAGGRACSRACWSAAPPSGPDRGRSTCRCR